MCKPENNSTATFFLQIQWYCLVAALESALAFLVMLIIPGDPKNAWLLGFSRTRVLILGLLFLCAILAGITRRAVRNNSLKFNKIIKLIHCLLSNPLSAVCLAIIPLLGTISSGWIVVELFLKGGFSNASNLRILPVFIWLFLLSIQSLALLFWIFKSKQRVENGENEKLCVDSSQVIFVQFFVITMIAISGSLVQIIHFCAPRELMVRFVPQQLLDFFLIKFNLGFKNNISVFFIALMLILCAFVFFIFSIYARQLKSPHTPQWQVLSIIFFLLSIDEIAELFPEIIRLLQRSVNFHISLLLPLLMVVVLLWFRRLIQDLPITRYTKMGIFLCVIGAMALNLARDYLLLETDGAATLLTELIKVFEFVFVMSIGALFTIAAFKLLFASTPINCVLVNGQCISIKTNDQHLLQFSLKKIFTIILGILFLIFVINVFLFAAQNSQFFLNLKPGITFELLYAKLFNPNIEVSFPTHYSTILLMIAAVLLLLIGYLDSDFTGWKFLSFVFLLLAIDETASLHEMLSESIEIPNVPGQFQHYFWFVPLIPFLIVLAITYIRFWLRLPKTEKILFVLSGSLYLFGAVGMEIVGGVLNMAGGVYSMAHDLATVLEEMMEMGGVILFIYTLLHYIENLQPQFKIQLTRQMTTAQEILTH